MNTEQKLELRKAVALLMGHTERIERAFYKPGLYDGDPNKITISDDGDCLVCWDVEDEDWQLVTQYERDPENAWEVVEKMHKLKGGAPWLDIDLAELLAMPADEAALAICKAAVKS